MFRLASWSLVAVCVGCSNSESGATTSPIDYGGLPVGYTPVAELSKEPVTAFSEAERVIQEGTDYAAVMETDAGRVVITFYVNQAPNAVNSFVFLSLNHYYDGVAFHRVLEDFVAQSGDRNTVDMPTATWGFGTLGYSFGIETSPDLRFDSPGVLGLARGKDPNSNGSQFFITLAPTPNLDGGYTVFGKLTEGLEVLPEIARSPEEDVPPANPTRIVSVRIGSKPR